MTSKGIDKATITSEKIEPVVERLFNLEELIWEPLTESGEHILDENGNETRYIFSLKEVVEDKTNRFILGKYPPRESEFEKLDWKINKFVGPNEGAIEKEENRNWIKLIKKQPTAEVVANDNVVIAREWKADEGGEVQWLELHVYDYREDGKGILGMEIDLEWNGETMELGSEPNVKSIFDEVDLPLFQSVGELKKSNKKEILQGISAAALPGAGMGKTLGNVKDEEGSTLFARIPFNIEDYSKNRDVKIKVNMIPAAGGMSINDNDLVVLDDDSPDIWLVETKAEQTHVGAHTFALTRGEDETIETRNLVVTVRNTNDKPRVLNDNEITAEDLNISVLQGQEIKHNTGKLFYDEDNEKLRYSIEEDYEWLKIDQDTEELIGITGNSEVGEHKIKIRAIDRKGESAIQELLVTVWNVNDSLEVGTRIMPPEVYQDEAFQYQLPEDAFTDPDLQIDTDEKLRYEINGPEWLMIDESSGTISGRPRQKDVGEATFIIKAIDKEGRIAEQEVSMKIKNINDSPVPNIELENFIRRQKREARYGN